MRKLIQFMMAALLVVVGTLQFSVSPANAEEIQGSIISLQADTGNWLSRCNDCQKVVGSLGSKDTATVHIDRPTSNPAAQFQVFNVGNGKIALRADTGKYLARCNDCIVDGKYPDFATFHVSDAFAPEAQFIHETLPNGKHTFKADNGKYLARCHDCSPGAKYPDTATFHVNNAQAEASAQWIMSPKNP